MNLDLKQKDESSIERKLYELIGGQNDENSLEEATTSMLKIPFCGARSNISNLEDATNNEISLGDIAMNSLEDVE